MRFRLPYKYERRLRPYKGRLKIFGLIILLLGGVYAADRTLPNQHLPWRAIDPNAPIGVFTKLQMMRLSLSPSSVCTQTVEQADTLSSIAAKRHRPKGPCGWDIAQTVSRASNIGFSPGASTMQCPLAIGSHVWLNSADKSARKRLGSGISKVYHAGTFSCRRQRGNNSGAWSEHAFANAWDITGFKLEDGRVISVLKDWDGEKDRQRFLRDVRNSACDIFRVTLSPDYNAAHADHFHVDMGPVTSCR